MKLVKDIAKSFLPSEEKKIVHAVQDVFVLKYLEFPVMSDEVTCPMCGGKSGYVVYIDPKISDHRMWFCAEPNCLAKVKRSRVEHTNHTAKQKRSIEWPLFCEINHIGDLHHDVTFEKMTQSSAKIDYLLKFAQSPKGIILMEGKPGTGKTYACMALCELFTRKNSSCLFYTGARLFKEWLKGFKEERPSGFKEKVMDINLLVVDDFGTGEPTKSFMEFFMDVINTRMQWSNRGTVITTNLNPAEFIKFCGNALSDRINTGQKFEFSDKSRRKQIVL